MYMCVYICIFKYKNRRLHEHFPQHLLYIIYFTSINLLEKKYSPTLRHVRYIHMYIVQTRFVYIYIHAMATANTNTHLQIGVHVHKHTNIKHLPVHFQMHIHVHVETQAHCQRHIRLHAWHICSYIFIDVQKHLTQQIQIRMHQDTPRICSFPNTNPFRIFNFLHIHMYACNHISARKDIFHMRMHQNLYKHFHFHVHLQTPKQFFSNTENTLIFKHKHIHAQLQRQLHYSQACLQVTYHTLAHWHKHVNLQRHIHGNTHLQKHVHLQLHVQLQLHVPI